MLSSIFSGGNDLIVILVAVVVLFGGTQLPKLARNTGEALREFRKSHSEAEAALGRQCARDAARCRRPASDGAGQRRKPGPGGAARGRQRDAIARRARRHRWLTALPRAKPRGRRQGADPMVAMFPQLPPD